MQAHPSFIFIRHGQSVHNQRAKSVFQRTPKSIDWKTTPQYKMIKFDESLADGSITSLGKNQASSAKSNKKLDDVDIVVVSPLRRALQTCDIIFGDRLDKVKVFVDPLMTQLITSAIDIGVRIKQSKQIYGKKFDFSRVPENDQENWFMNLLNEENKKQILQISEKQNRTIASSAIHLLKNCPLQSDIELKKRTDKLKQELIKYKQMSQKKVALIGHSYTFRFLTATGFHQDMTPINQIHFNNCQMKQVPIIIQGYHQQQQDIVPFCRIP